MRIAYKSLFITFFSFLLFAMKGFAGTCETTVAPTGCDTTISTEYCCSETARKVFSLGRGVGASYYHIIDLSDRSRSLSFKELQEEYNKAFQSLNIIDIILNDINIKGKARYDLNNIRKNFYDALRQQDLSETKLAFVRDMFVVFYENLSREVNMTHSCKGSWLLSLGFYTSFQLESLHSSREEKILLSGFQKILGKRPISVPAHVYDNLINIYKLDKPLVTQEDLNVFERSLTTISGYFTNYPDTKPLFNEVQDLIGIWQGILFNPNNEKYDIRLSVKEDLTASMDIDGIAHNVMISDVKVVNNYFTFMFKPFGTEKLYMRFNAKLSENIFSGEITDVLGEKGYWVLAKTDEKQEISEAKLNTMISYISEIEESLKNKPSVDIELSDKTIPEAVETGETIVSKEAEETEEIIEVSEVKEEPEIKELNDIKPEKTPKEVVNTVLTPDQAPKAEVITVNKNLKPTKQVDLKPIQDLKPPAAIDINGIKPEVKTETTEIKETKTAEVKEEVKKEKGCSLKKLKNLFGRLFSFFKFL